MKSRSAAAEPRAVLRRARPLLGTLVEIEVRFTGEEARALSAVERAFAVIARVHHLMSPADPESDLSRLHAAPPGRWVAVHAQTAAVLRSAQSFHRASGGAFDPVAWSGGTMADIELSARRRVRRLRAVRLDLGGIAKGFAVDRACEMLRRRPEIVAGLVNAGGDLRCFGPRATRIYVRAPGGPAIAFTLRLRNAALATSGRAFSPGPLVGLVDPRSGRPYRGPRSVTIGARTALAADALTKVALFAPPDVREKLLRRYGARAYLQDSP